MKIHTKFQDKVFNYFSYPSIKRTAISILTMILLGIVSILIGLFVLSLILNLGV
jgi:hypothetical protein